MEASISRPDFDRSSVSRYIQLATLFRRRIESGVWQAGTQIPTLEELTEELGVSRATVRQAVGVLETQGLVSRHRAKGTFVRSAPEQLHIEVETDWNGLLNARADSVIQVLDDDVGGPPPSRDASIGALAQNYRRLKRLHRHSGQPFLVAEVYIDAALAAKLPAEAFATTTAMRLATSIPGVTIANAIQSLSIGTADLEVASLLDLPLNGPFCYIDRTAVSKAGRVVVISKGIYRGDVVRMDMKLK